MTHYPLMSEVLAIHEDQIRRYGGAKGVRDFGLIDAALNRPQIGYYTDLIEEAAALWESLSQNHPFVDGNKRTAFAVTDVFLRMNGYRIDVDPINAYQAIIALYESGSFNFTQLEGWLRCHVRQVEGFAV